MLGRNAALIFPGLLSLALGLNVPNEARAHRLVVETNVLGGCRVQIDGWFDQVSGAVPAQGGEVEVYRQDGKLLTRGTLDDQGIFLFSFAEPLRIVVSAGPDHRKEFVIDAALLAQAPAGNRTEPVPVPVDRSSRVSIKDVLVGLGFLLGLAAFVISLRNAKKLRDLSGKK